MENIFDFIKGAIVILTTTISVLNPFNISSQNSRPLELPTPIPSDVQPTITPTKTPSIQGVQTYQDPDPVIECQNPNCGSINIRKSLCSNTVGYVCCQVDNSWTWYASRSKCSQDQQSYLNNQLPKNAARNTTSSEPTITCVLSWGTYQLPKSYCDAYKSWRLNNSSTPNTTNNQDPVITCQSRGEDLVIKKSLCDSLVDCQIGNEYFLLYPNDCTRLQVQHLNETQESAPPYDNQLNIQNNSECKNDAKKWYDNMYAQYGRSTGTGDFALKVYEPQYQQMLVDCDRLYPL